MTTQLKVLYALVTVSILLSLLGVLQVWRSYTARPVPGQTTTLKQSALRANMSAAAEPDKCGYQEYSSCEYGYQKTCWFFAGCPELNSYDNCWYTGEECGFHRPDDNIWKGRNSEE